MDLRPGHGLQCPGRHRRAGRRAQNLTPATVTADGEKNNLAAIQTGLKDIAGAEADLSSDRRSEAEAATKAFTSSVKGIASQFGTSLSASVAKAKVVAAFDQLAAS